MIRRLLNKLGAPRGAFLVRRWDCGGRRAATGLCVGLGLQVVLCLATPGSPTKYAQCVPPITKLWNVLAMGGSFPTCTGVGIAPEGEARL
jgi:hypothetical protein